MIWKCIYFCNLPKSVFPTLCQFVPSKVKLSDCQREYSNLLYSAFYPIILSKKTTKTIQSGKQLNTRHIANWGTRRLKTCRMAWPEGPNRALIRAALQCNMAGLATGYGIVNIYAKPVMRQTGCALFAFPGFQCAFVMFQHLAGHFAACLSRYACSKGSGQSARHNN